MGGLGIGTSQNMSVVNPDFNLHCSSILRLTFVFKHNSSLLMYNLINTSVVLCFLPLRGHH